MSGALSPTRWLQLAARLGLANATVVFTQLQRQYGGRTRYYHDAARVNHCLGHLDRCRAREAANPLVEFAIWFQDAIFSTMSLRNERRSADWAASVLGSARASPEACALVREMILATGHRDPPIGPEAQLVADVDLAPLGMPPAQFRDSEERIRAEYGWVPRKLYRSRRLDLLRELARRSTLFSLEYFQRRYEQQARINIAWLLDQPHGETATFRWPRLR